MTDAGADPFDRAAAREAELRERADRREERKRVAPWQKFSSQLTGFAFFGFLLPIHVLVVRELTPLVIAHMVMIALTATSSVQAWARIREEEARRNATR